MDAKPKRRWYQFSLRTLLLVLTLLCVGPGGYLVYERRKAAIEKEAVERIWKLDGKVYRDSSAPNRSPAMTAVLGDDSNGSIVGVELDSPMIGDAELVQLESFPHLKSIYLPKTHVTDVGISIVARQTELEEVDLSNTSVTDASLSAIQTLTHLKELDLNGTKVTDFGLEKLSQLKSLESLFLNGTQVTDEGVAKLQKALPNCRISH